MDNLKDYSTRGLEFVGKNKGSDNDFVASALLAHIKLFVGISNGFVDAALYIKICIL